MCEVPVLLKKGRLLGWEEPAEYAAVPRAGVAIGLQGGAGPWNPSPEGRKESQLPLFLLQLP